MHTVKTRNSHFMCKGKKMRYFKEIETKVKTQMSILRILVRDVTQNWANQNVPDICTVTHTYRKVIK